MADVTIRPPLTNVQAELLKLFSVDIPEVQLIELKKVIAGFLLSRAREKADTIWDEKGYTDDKILKELLDKD